VDRESFRSLLGDLEWRSGLFGDRETDFLSELGEWETDGECERCLACGGVGDRFASDVDLERVRDLTLRSVSTAIGHSDCWRLGLGVADRLRLDPDRLITGACGVDGDLEASRSLTFALCVTLT